VSVDAHPDMKKLNYALTLSFASFPDEEDQVRK
jgi:hypothetical protein